MLLKGYRVKAIFSLDMPSNFINYFLSTVFLSYWIFWHLIQFPGFNKFFSLTTFTHYYRRYHQPETKLKHLAGNKRKNTTPELVE